MKNPLTGISTADLETRIERLLAEIDPGENNGSVSFGINLTQWTDLHAAVTEYIRICRNSRSAHKVD